MSSFRRIEDFRDLLSALYPKGTSAREASQQHHHHPWPKLQLHGQPHPYYYCPREPLHEAKKIPTTINAPENHCKRENCDSNFYLVRLQGIPPQGREQVFF